MVNIRIPKEIDKIFYGAVYKLCPLLPDKSRRIIVDCLRGNFSNDGFIKEKIFNKETITLLDLYSSFIANNRHKRTEYDNEKIRVRKQFNNHEAARGIFLGYMKEIFEESAKNKEYIDNEYHDKAKEDFWKNVFNNINK